MAVLTQREHNPWLNETNPVNLLRSDVCKRNITARKLRLLAVAACRLLPAERVPEPYRRALEIAEAYADDPSEGRMLELAQAFTEVLEMRMSVDGEVLNAVFGATGVNTDIEERTGVNPDGTIEIRVRRYRYEPMTWTLQTMAVITARLARGWDGGPTCAARLCDLVRDVCDPFGRWWEDRERHWERWNDGMVLKMAQSIYQARSWDELPILADALEDAAYDNVALLEHLRGPGPHTRGCFALDWVLGLHAF